MSIVWILENAHLEDSADIIRIRKFPFVHAVAASFCLLKNSSSQVIPL